MYKSKIKKTIIVLTLLLTSAFNTAFLGFAADPAFTLSSSNSGGSVLADFGGSLDVVHLTAPDQAGWDSGNNIGTGVNEGRIEIPLPAGFTLADLESIAWDVWTDSGYPPHVDLLLDIDDDGVFDGGKKDLVTGAALPGNLDDVLVFEFAYQPYSDIATSYGYIAPGDPYGHYDPALQGAYYSPTYGEWLETFQQTISETDTTQINDASIGWLYSGLPGPYTGGFFGTLSDFKAGSVESIGDSLSSGVTSDTVVLALQIEVDNWLGDADAYVDNIAIIGLPQIDIISPESTTYGPGDISLEIVAEDVMGIKSVSYTLEKTGDPTPGVDQLYTAPTTLSGLVDGEYTLTVVATNDNDLSSEKSVTFNVNSQVTVDIHPETLNLRSGGRWVTVKITLPEGMSPDEFDIDAVRLWVDGEGIEPEWGRICIDDEEHSVMVKFSRAALISPLVDSLTEPDEEDKFLDVEVSLRVTGDLPGGGSFEHKDTIRVIYPGNGKMLAHQTLNRGQLKKQENALSGNKGKGPKEDKPGKGPKGNNGNGKNKGNK